MIEITTTVKRYIRQTYFSSFACDSSAYQFTFFGLIYFLGYDIFIF